MIIEAVANVAIKAFLPALEQLLEVYGIRLGRRAPKAPKIIETKLAAATKALQEASEYIGALEVEMNSKKAALEATTKNYQHYQALAETEKQKAEAILTEVSTRMAKGQVRERVWSFFLGIIGNLIIFLAGVYFADQIKGWFGAVP